MEDYDYCAILPQNYRAGKKLNIHREGLQQAPFRKEFVEYIYSNIYRLKK